MMSTIIVTLTQLLPNLVTVSYNGNIKVTN